MEYLDTVFASMLNAGVALPALMIGYYLSIRKLRAFLLPLFIFGIADHLAVKLLYIAELQQNTFIKLGTSVIQIDWQKVLLENLAPNLIAFYLIGFAAFFALKLLHKVKM